MQSLGGMPLAEFVYRRCATSRKSDIAAIVTSSEDSDNELFEYCISKDIPVFRGPLDNVLERYILAAEFYASPLVCRVCGDSPFVDTGLIDNMFDLMEREALDYVAPDKKFCMAGLDSEAVTLDALKRSRRASTAKDELEHVTLYIKNNADNFSTKYIKTDLKPRDLDAVSITVDYPEDLDVCNKILKLAGNKSSFRSEDIFDAMRIGR